MSIRNVEDSEDNHFLKGFESPLSNSNMLSELCKVESGLFEPSPRYDVKPEMEEEEGASGGRGSVRRTRHLYCPRQVTTTTSLPRRRSNCKAGSRSRRSSPRCRRA